MVLSRTLYSIARFGISDGNGENVFYTADVQIGHGYRFLNYDILGISLSWNQPNISEVKDQYSMELFYRINMTGHFEITPSLQYIRNPTFNANATNLFYLGLRGWITL
ncbi:carbohydrate porin [Eudoraea chungangensis]|uniref:carbohydrate porin n=1 Tax=Eudoraea chungangensis TaxID=1481905 RepID=UPI0023ED31E8|nr:carbohydrate porin [Eudoraea chungangensis]